MPALLSALTTVSGNSALAKKQVNSKVIPAYNFASGLAPVSYTHLDVYKRQKLDSLIIEFDTGLRTLLAKPRSVRPHPDVDVAESALSEVEKKQVSALMRINHTGEVCAQALYSGCLLYTSRCV